MQHKHDHNVPLESFLSLSIRRVLSSMRRDTPRSGRIPLHIVRTLAWTILGSTDVSRASSILGLGIPIEGAGGFSTFDDQIRPFLATWLLVALLPGPKLNAVISRHDIHLFYFCVSWSRCTKRLHSQRHFWHPASRGGSEAFPGDGDQWHREDSYQLLIPC